MDAASIVTIITSVTALVVGIITARSSASRDELKSVREALADLQGENKRLQERNLILTDRVAKLECENQAIREENINLRAQVRNLEEENTDLKERLDVLEKKKRANG